MPAVLVDRDGVINENRADYVTRWEHFRFLPQSVEALAALKDVAVAVVTNQSCVGRGLLARDALNEIHERMVAHCATNGAFIDGVFTCPHAPWEGCDCRKPRPGLLLRAMDALGEAAHNCLAIGDGHEDLLAARSAGVPFALVHTGRGMQTLGHPACRRYPPLFVVRDLRQAAEAARGYFSLRPARRAA
jgi:D-glycero-D-manno-heptose 1,7-bisphosphate phosphatase